MKQLLLAALSLLLGMGLTKAEERTVTFDFVNETYGLERLSGSTSEYIAPGTTIENDGITISFIHTATTSTTRLWNDGLRIYKDTKFEISVTGGGKITNIEPATSNAASIKFIAVR